ncbi:ATPase AAA-type core [Trinorchestia longiramus]|nr:ATPase AAA-type core [Trinorchestia longiramus]
MNSLNWAGCFSGDGVHLSQEGETKLSQRFIRWIKATHILMEGIVQHLLLSCTCGCTLQEHLSRARVAVRKVHRLVPAQSISLRPDFSYDAGVSRWTCHGVIMHLMSVKTAPYSGHPFLFTESSRIFIGDVYSKHYLTVTSVTPAPQNSTYPVLTLGSNGMSYYAGPEEEEDWEELFRVDEGGSRRNKNGICWGGETRQSNASKSGVDVNKKRHSNISDANSIEHTSRPVHSNNKDVGNYCSGNVLLNESTNKNSKNLTHVQSDILNEEENEILHGNNERVLTSTSNTPVTKTLFIGSETVDTPKSHKSTSKVFVHSISQSSFSAHESSVGNIADVSSVNESRDPVHGESDDELTLYYITSETRIVLLSFDPYDDVPDCSPVKEEKQPYYYNPQVEVVMKRLVTCLSHLQEIGSRQCLTVQCGVVLHGAPFFELELMAKQSAQQLCLSTITALCDFSNKREVAKLYASARKKNPAMVIIQMGDTFLCDSMDGEPNPAVPVLLEVLQSLWESRSTVVTVCICNKIEKLSNKVRKALGFDVYNVLPDVSLREVIIRRFLQHKGYFIQSQAVEREARKFSNLSVRDLGEERSSEIDQNSSGCASLVEMAADCSVPSTSAYEVQVNEVNEAKVTEDADEMENTATVQDEKPKNHCWTKIDQMKNTATAPKGKTCREPDRKLKCYEEDVATLAKATVYCSCAEVHEIVHKKLLEEGDISGGLPADFVPHLIRANDRGFVPPTRWEDILGYSSLKNVLQRMVREYREDPERCPLQSLLLYGPPGCGKTMFVKALATETSFSYFLILGSVVLSKYVGETEKLVRGVVERAKAAAPSIVFIDELESLCEDRGSDNTGAPVALLLELISSCAPTPQDPLTSVLFVGATNMPHLIDQGLLQAGYLSRMVHVGLPDCVSRCALWQGILKRVTCKEDNIDMRLLCQLTSGFSGAEMRGIYNEAGHKLLREHGQRATNGSDSSTSNPIVTQKLLVDAITATRSRIPASLLAAIDDFTATRTGVIEAS